MILLTYTSTSATWLAQSSGRWCWACAKVGFYKAASGALFMNKAYLFHITIAMSTCVQCCMHATHCYSWSYLKARAFDCMRQGLGQVDIDA